MVSVARALAAVLVLLGSPLAVVPASGAMAAEITRAEVSSVVASEGEDPYANACGAARALIATDPERAVRLVVDVRSGTGLPTPAPSTAARAEACESVLDEIVASQAIADPQLDDVEYCQVLDALREAEAEDQAAALADVREPPFACDDATEAWVAAARADSPLDASETGDAWDEFVTDTLEPLAQVFAVLLAAWAALIVLARLLVFFPFRDRKTSRRLRIFLATAGLIAIVVGPIWFVLGATRNPVDPIGVVIGVLIGSAGAALTGLWIGSLPRLTVEVTGEKKHGVDAGLIASVLRDMLGRPGRRIEIPVGPDLADLGTSVSEVSKNDWIALAQRVLILITNVKPWRIQVEVISESTVSVVIGRNGHQLAARRIDAQFGRSSDNIAEADCTDAQRIAAYVSGLIIATMRDRYVRDFTPGLHGATKYDAIALQYIASRWYVKPEDTTAALVLLLRARRNDPSAQLAVVTYQYYKHRFDTRTDKMREYLVWLDGQVRKLSKTDDKRDHLSGDLAASLTVTYATIWRNWTAARAAEKTSPAKRRDWLDHPGKHFPGRPAKNGPSPIELIERRMNAMKRTKPTRMAKFDDVDARRRHDILKIDWYLLHPDRDVSQLMLGGCGSDSVPGGDVLELGESPDVAYDLACALARSNPPNPRVKSLIRCAFDDPENVDWARKDPELLNLRELKWFKELTEQAEAELGVPPFKSHVAKLNVKSREELAKYDWKPSSPLDATLVGRLRSSAKVSLAADKADADTPEPQQLGAAARTTLVRHLHERRASPLTLDDAQRMALWSRLREVGYLGTLHQFEAWIARLNRVLETSVPVQTAAASSAPSDPRTRTGRRARPGNSRHSARRMRRRRRHASEPR